MTQSPSIFYTAVYNKGDKTNNIISLITSNSEIINKPFETFLDNKKIVHSPLTLSIYLKYSKTAKLLIEKGADVNYKTQPDEDYPLQIACRQGCEEIVKILIDNPKVNINCLNKHNETCFNIAIKSSHMSIYNMLVSKVKNQKKDNNTKKVSLFKEVQKHFNSSKAKIAKKHDTLEIPLSFRNNVNGTLRKFTITNKELGNDNSKTPTLFLDMDKMKEDETKKENTQLKGTISQLQEKIKALTKEVCQLYKLRILV